MNRNLPSTGSETSILVVASTQVNMDLEAVIEALANEEFPASERETGIILINQWEQGVIKNLHLHADEVQKFIRLLSGSYYYNNDELIDVGEDLADKTDTIELYEHFVNEVERYNHMKAPDKPIIDLNTTYGEKLMLEQDYELNCKRHEINSRKQHQKAERARTAWLDAVKAHETTKAALKQAKSYVKNLSKHIATCEQKAQVARLNVGISSPQRRAAIKALLDFKVL